MSENKSYDRESRKNWRRQMEKRIAASDSERGTILANQSGYATDEDSPQEISLYRPPDMEALMGRHAWKPAHCFQLPNALPPLPPPPPAPIFAEELHLLCLENLPRSCTIADVIDFFESRHTGPSVSVFLGHDGVIMQSYYSEVFAFVLIKSRIGRECAKLKDNRWIKNKQIRVKNEGVDVFHAMFRKGCFQRRNDDCELGKQVILKNLPKKTLFVDVGIILEPFNVWLDKDEGYKEMIMDIDSPSLECTLVMCEELVAYYVYMKKNRKIFCVGDTMAQIFVQMPLYISPLDNAYNEGTTDSSSELQNIVRFPNPHPRRRATVVTLTNLPLNIQKSDIIEIFKERIMIPACSINLIQVCPWSISAAIFFTYKGEYLPQEAGIIAVDNIRSFSIGERRITVETLCFTER